MTQGLVDLSTTNIDENSCVFVFDALDKVGIRLKILFSIVLDRSIPTTCFIDGNIFNGYLMNPNVTVPGFHKINVSSEGWDTLANAGLEVETGFTQCLAGLDYTRPSRSSILSKIDMGIFRT